MPHTPQPARAFIPMMALMMSMVALAIDIMLPAFPAIRADLGVVDPADVQLVLTVLFLGFAFSQLIVGPLSDTYGRRPVIFITFGLVVMGGLLSALATSFEMLLVGRFLQGVGIAGPRILANAIIRDLFDGRGMARVMSTIMMTFIMVPVLAPLVGQSIEIAAGWRAIFAFLIIMALISCTWYGLSQAETLAPENRRPFSIGMIARGIAEVFRTRPAIGYTITNGMMFGPFLAYLSTTQAIYQDIYKVGTMFPLYFALGAGTIGIASFVNAKLVERLGMLILARKAFAFAFGAIGLFCIWCLLSGGIPPMWTFVGFVMIVFFCIGLNFGNITALAMEPLGHMAGMGAAVFGCASTLISLPIAWGIGQAYADTVTPLAFGFLIAAGLALVSFEWAARAR
ncbi:MAG: multidrug effflux MFS transporter [Planktomarina sp.]